MAQKSRLQSQRIAERIKQLEAEQREAEAKEDQDADALLLRLARRAHMRDDFIKQATAAVKAHERELARQRERDAADGQDTPTIGG